MEKEDTIQQALIEEAEVKSYNLGKEIGYQKGLNEKEKALQEQKQKFKEIIEDIFLMNPTLNKEVKSIILQKLEGKK